MSIADDIPLLERPSFFDGQRLMAHDLAAAQVFNRELRWLHNRALHSWGIAFGFAVTGARGDHSVKVDAGYAIDCMGRDLVLNGPVEMPIPAVASASSGGAATYYLTASYAEDVQLDPITRAGTCKTSGAVRRPEIPLLRWQDPTDTDPTSRYQYGRDVVLASVHILNCQLTEDASSRERRDAIPPQQPYVAAGHTTAGDTAWRLWPNDNAAIGVATTVTTSGAGFQTTPRYYFHIAGERMFQAGAGGQTFIVDGYAQVVQTTASSFEVNVILSEGATAGIGQADTFTMDDYRAVVSRILTANPEVSAEVLVALNGPGLSVGQSLLITIGPLVRPVGQLVAKDFETPLQAISKRKKVSFERMLEANGWATSLSNVSLVLGQVIAIPGAAVALNEAKVFDPKFMEKLKKDLAWHVVWMGVEG
jgi:hypothetical protein